MNYKLEGDKQLAQGNYLESYNNYRKYQEAVNTEESIVLMKQAKDKYELYKELCNFLKKDENKYYDVLNIKQNSTQKEIKESFIKLMNKYHPHKTKIKESNSVARIINKAYIVLNDPKKRKEYDTTLEFSKRSRQENDDWIFQNENVYQPRYMRTNRYQMHESPFIWMFYNDEQNLFNNILYRNFVRYAPSRRLSRVDLNEHRLPKIVIILLLFFFILLV